jgi:hypothetical protein
MFLMKIPRVTFQCCYHTSSLSCISLSFLKAQTISSTYLIFQLDKSLGTRGEIINFDGFTL